MRKLLILLVAFCLNFKTAKATDFTQDDSCVQGVGLLIRFVDDITTFGLYEGYSYNFHMMGAPGTTSSTGELNAYGSGDDATYGCNANYYPSPEGGEAYLHNSTYCQSDGTNCCPQSIDPLTGSPFSNSVGKPAFCKEECIPSGGVEYCYESMDTESGSTSCTPTWGASGDYVVFKYPPTNMRVVNNDSYLCVQFLTTLGYQTIGCKSLPNCTQDIDTVSCNVAPACYDFLAMESRFFIPITSAIMQCINDTLKFLFYGNSGCESSENSNMDYTLSVLSNFQGQLREVVRSMLLIYLILAGMKMTLSSQHTGKAEFAKITAKFILVLYFSTGININGVVDSNGQPYYDDGIHRFMYPLFINGSTQLAEMVYSAGGKGGICSYNSSNYPKGYGYLSMWDSLDCRIMYYFGIDIASMGVDSFDDATVLTQDDFGDPMLLSLLIPAFLTYEPLFLIFSIVYCIFIISILIYFLNVSVLSAILVAIMLYIAPIFVPMALFEPTKGYYESWLRLTISYSLQPMIIAAYIALMFSVFDQSMFGNCLFEKIPVNFSMDGVTKTGIPFFNICDPDDASEPCFGISPCNQSYSSSNPPSCSGDSCTVNACLCSGETTTGCYSTSADTSSSYIQSCKDTVGYYLNPTATTSYTNSLTAIFFQFPQLDNSVAYDLVYALVPLCIFAYLFYKFAEVLSDFAAELTGGDSIGAAAGSPMALAKKAFEMAKEVAKAALTEGTSRASSAASASSSDSSKPRSNTTSSSSK